MKKRMTALLSALLVLMTSSCASQTDDNPNQNTEATETESVVVYPNYDGRTVTFFVREDNLRTEFYVEEETADIIDISLFKRKHVIDDRYNVNLKFEYSPGDFWADRDKFINSVQTSVMANDGAYDIIGGVSVVMPTLMLNNLLCNLTEVEELHFDEPWWNATLMDELPINGKLYLASGDASLGLISGMMCIFFNKDMIESKNMENPYELVTDGKWTFDRLVSMAKDAYADLNGNATVDEGDCYGFTVANTNHLNNFIDSFDLKIIDRKSDGSLYFSFGSEKVIEAVEKISEALNSVPGFVYEKEGKSVYADTFRNGNALFTSAEFYYSINLRDVESDFGIIPYPKWNEAQENYIGASRSTFTLFGLPVSVDTEIAGTILEAFAKESYETVSPAYYETALKVKYSRDDISAQMFDLIRGGIRFQFGITYSGVLDNVSTFFKGQVMNGNWASYWASKESSCQARLAELLEAMK